MKVKIKKLHPDAVIPKYAKPGDAGLDLTATEMEIDKESGMITYKVGLAVEIPDGHVGLVFPRSSISKTFLSLSNAVAVIDSQFRGEFMFKMRYPVAANRLPVGSSIYNVGDRIAQLIIIPYPQIEFEEVGELGTTERGEGGFGSSGN
jgi:dUTP pyrophosphatase